MNSFLIMAILGAVAYFATRKPLILPEEELPPEEEPVSEGELGFSITISGIGGVEEGARGLGRGE